MSKIKEKMTKSRLNLRNMVKIGVAYLAVCMMFIACDKDNGNGNNDDPGGNGNENNNKWIQKANYPAAAVANAVAFSINGKIYVGMGSNATGDKNDLWEYDPATNKWTEKKDFPGQTNTAYFVVNDKAYVLYLNQMWEYSPTNDSWIQKADCPTHPTFGVCINNKGYVGILNSYSNSQSFYEYSPETDTWKQCADFVGLNRRAITAVSTGQNAYIIGGNGPVCAGYESKLRSDNFWTYSPINDKWTQKADFPSGIGLVYGLSFCREGVIYAGLGIESRQGSSSASSADRYTYIDEIYKYDANNNSWNSFGKPPISQRCLAISVVCNGKLYIGLGVYRHPFYGAGPYHLDFWEYSF